MKCVNESPTVIALSGGIGGAKLALGLSNALSSRSLMIIGNIGDDFVHYGLYISPDLDTLMYTISGNSDTEKGWGLAEESWDFMKSLGRLGGETWFNLGDKDLATHLERTRRIMVGESLTEITSDFCRKFKISAQILPVSNDSVKTIVETENGDMDFQDYFVRDQCKAVVSGFRFEGSGQAEPNPLFMEALSDPSLRAVVICPSNPFLSIDPMLAVRGVREKLRDCSAPVIAVTPIINGNAVKGPAAKIIQELGYTVSPYTVAEYYKDFLDGFVVDIQDKAGVCDIKRLGLSVEVSNTIMTDLASKTDLAQVVLKFAVNCEKNIVS